MRSINGLSEGAQDDRKLFSSADVSLMDSIHYERDRTIRTAQNRSVLSPPRKSES